MFRNRRKLAPFITVFGCFFLLETLFVSAHIHLNTRVNRDEVTCPVCQLARDAVKFFHVVKVAKLHPLIVFTDVNLAPDLVTCRNIVQPSPIRGPPIA